jgi:uncharacterized protein (TIGR02246 family)
MEATMSADPVFPLSEADLEAIKSLTSAISQKALDGDWGKLVQLFTEDAVLLPPNSPVVRGRTAFQAMIESFNPDFSDHRIELQDIQGYGDVAYAWGTYTETFSVGGAPEPITDIAKLMFGFRKQPDGSWLVATEMWNTDLS